jgi:hypothetical protein
VRHRRGGQVDAEQPGQAGIVRARREHGLRQQAVAEQRQGLEDHARRQPEGVHPTEQVQVLARPDQFGHHQVLDDQQHDEDEDAAAQRLDQERQPGTPAPPPTLPISPSLCVTSGVSTGLPTGLRRVSPHNTALPGMRA